MLKRIVILLLVLVLAVAIVACKKKVESEIPSSDESSSFVDKGVPGGYYDEGDDLTSSDLEKLESEVLTNSNVEIVIPGNSSSDSSDSSDSSNSSDTSSTQNASSNKNTAFY